MVASILVAVASMVLGQTANITHTGSRTEGLQYPGRLAADGSGGVYVTEQTTKQVLHYDNAGALAGTYPIAQGPVGIAVHPAGNIFVSRLDGQVGVYDAAFAPQAPSTLPQPPIPFPPMVAPNGLAMHPATGELFVADSGGHQVLVYDGATGDWLRSFGMQGSEAGELQSPQALAVDPVLNQVIVADVDNFNAEIFDATTGIAQDRFGYRIAYLPMSTVAWFARSEGLAVDACGNIYVADALMGTVRVFDSAGDELDINNPPITFGTGAGEVRLPVDVMIDGAKLYVSSSGNAAVEVYDLTCTTPPAPRPSGRSSDTPDLLSSRKLNAAQPRQVDNPFDIVEAMRTGEYAAGLDVNRDRKIDLADLAAAVETFGAGTVEDFTGRDAYTASQQPPHMIDIDNTCNRCHAMNGLPEGMLSAAGQENLCLSCHSGSSLAMETPIAGSGHGDSHVWGVPADQGDVLGPEPGSLLSWNLDDGDIRCGTCHNPHESTYGEPYLRATVDNANLCGECHKEAEEWRHAGHADETAEAFVHYDWSQSSRSACRQCHTGNGFIDHAAGLPPAQQNGAFRVVDCVVCHAPHGRPQDELLLRIYDDVTLPTEGPDETLTGKGAMAICMSCHNGRRAPDDGSLTPHYMLGAVMLEGLNGNDFGYTLVNSQHTNVGATCMDCHMSAGPAEGQPGHGKLGGHTFNMKVHDAGDPDFGAENLSGCNAAACHGGTGPLTTLNRMAYGDYDGNGTVEGVQDEVQGLMNLGEAALEAKGAVHLTGYPYWDLSGVDPADDPLVRDAVWNWEYVKNSGDLGIKNTAYAVGLLQVTYLALTGADVPDAELRYSQQRSDTHVNILNVNGGTAVEVGGAWTIGFTIEDDDGDAIAIGDLDRLRFYVSGPATNYQIVLPSTNIVSLAVQNPDGSYTYTAAAPFPAVYAAPLNDSPDLTEGELTGLPLLDGTYTVLIEARRSFGSVRKASDATLDFVVTNDPASPPILAPRQFVTREACNQCHNDLQLHGGGRFAVTGCVFCHTAGSEDSITDPASTPGLTVEFSNMIHKIHRGHALRSIEATAAGADPYRYIIRGHNGSPADFSDVGFPILPMGITDCGACHGGSLQASEIFTSPTRKGCGGCHDDLDFTTGTILNQDDPDVAGGLLTQADLGDPVYRAFPGHVGGVGGQNHIAASDNFCAGCHAPGALVDALAAHQHPTVPAQEGTEPAIEIVDVGGMTGGGGTYFVAGDYPEVTFKLSNNTTDPLQIVPGDSSILNRLEIALAGPTALYQQIVAPLRPWNNGNLGVPAGNWIDDFTVDGTYTFIFTVPIPANYPPQANSIGEPPADQIFPFEEGWGQQYTLVGTPLDAGTYTVLAWGRRVTPIAGEREPIRSDQFDIPFGANDPPVPYAGTVTTEKCNVCHGTLALHGNQREGVNTCFACHNAGSQDGGTDESVDLRIMIHKLHNARNLTDLPYELNGNSGVADFSHLLISSMPGEAAECEVCHATDAWKNPPYRDNMRTWMVACTSCHDSEATRTHVDIMTDSGTFVEHCELCHGDGALFSIESVHASP